MELNIDIPFRLNFNDLDEDTQENLMRQSIAEVERKFGVDIKAYAKANHLDYETILEEEAIRNLYNYKFTFGI